MFVTFLREVKDLGSIRGFLCEGKLIEFSLMVASNKSVVFMLKIK